MKDQIKLVIGVRLVLCTRVVQGKSTFIRTDKDLGDARHMGFNYSQEANTLLSAARRVHWKQFFKSATSYINPLIIK